MKKQIIVLLFSSILVNSIAQNSFERLIQNEEDQIPTSLIEDVNSYIICSLFDKPDAPLIKLNTEGEIVDSLIIEAPLNGNCNISELGWINCEHFIALGEFNFDSTFNLWFIKADTGFNIICNEIFQMPGEIVGTYTNFLINSKGNIVISGSFIQSLPNNWDIFIFELDLSGTVVQEKFFGINTPGGKVVYDIVEQSINNYFITCNSVNLDNKGLCYIYQLDSTINIVNQYYIDFNIGNLNEMDFIEDSIFILSGVQYFGSLETQLGLLKIDLSFNIIDSIHFGKMGNDTVDYPAFHNNLNYISKENIYYAGTSNLDLFNPFFSSMPSWLLLAKLDNNFGVYWQKFYGGDACYNLWSILATQDGGCVMAGTRYDYQTQNQERDVYILKVNENGILTWTYNFPETTRQVIVYPNPGQNEIMIKSISPNLIFELFDMQGVKMLSKKIATEDRIDTKDLPQGMYIYQVLNPQAEIIETGKWIKN
jgi:hypothetical protein